MNSLKGLSRGVLKGGFILIFFSLFACAETTYVYQNGTGYNDYEAVNNYRIRSTTKKTKSQSKAPNWKQYNAQNKYKRYN